jgi:hypothetical protein
MWNKWPVAGLVAGFLIFMWGGLTHMAFNIDSYVKTVPNDEALLAVLQSGLKEPGVYFYPNEMDPEKLEARAKTAPRGILTYTPAGTPFSMGQSLAVQAVADVVCALFLAFLYSMAAPGLRTTAQRILFPTLIGIFTVFAVQVPYWNWYGFPAASIATGFLEQGVSGLIAGLVFWKLLK